MDFLCFSLNTACEIWNPGLGDPWISEAAPTHITWICWLQNHVSQSQTRLNDSLLAHSENLLIATSYTLMVVSDSIFKGTCHKKHNTSSQCLNIGSLLNSPFMQSHCCSSLSHAWLRMNCKHTTFLVLHHLPELSPLSRYPALAPSFLPSIQHQIFSSDICGQYQLIGASSQYQSFPMAVQTTLRTDCLTSANCGSQDSTHSLKHHSWF